MNDSSITHSDLVEVSSLKLGMDSRRLTDRRASRPRLPPLRFLLSALLILSFGIDLPTWLLPKQFGSYAYANNVTFVYDQRGFLIGVIDPAGNSATYNYDSVGNLKSITNQSSSTIAVFGFSPFAGPVGATVTIYGSSFSTTPSQNTVTFNSGVAASVSAATSTTLTTQVPTGATTGTIKITAPGGSATSGQAFTVVAASAPTITTFSPGSGGPNTAVTINGTNFQPTSSSNEVQFNGFDATVAAATATSISATTPANVTSGPITVTTPFGQAISSGDFFTTPPCISLPGKTCTPYVLDSGSAISVGGPGTTAAVNHSGDVALVAVAGTAGQSISLVFSNSTFGVSCPVSSSNHIRVFIYRPDGTSLILNKNGEFDQFCGTSMTFSGIQLQTSGSYSVVIAPTSSSGEGTGTIVLSATSP